MLRIILIVLILSSGFILFNRIFFKKKEISCYEKCSKFHFLEEAQKWDYSEFFIFENDTIWLDEQCYDLWCICVDECKPGLCCELLK